MHAWLAQHTQRQVIGLQTIPARDSHGQPVINQLTGWPDSLFYDIDLAVISPTLLAWCPEAFEPASQAAIRSLKGIGLIEVDYEEAVQAFACNLVSTGRIVVMSKNAPKLKAALENHGLSTITPPITQLAKGGGYIRCVTLTLE
jgi:N-dimethylarginine dimethylaminohydrolase